MEWECSQHAGPRWSPPQNVNSGWFLHCEGPQNYPGIYQPEFESHYNINQPQINSSSQFPSTNSIGNNWWHPPNYVNSTPSWPEEHEFARESPRPTFPTGRRSRFANRGNSFNRNPQSKFRRIRKPRRSPRDPDWIPKSKFVKDRQARRALQKERNFWKSRPGYLNRGPDDMNPSKSPKSKVKKISAKSKNTSEESNTSKKRSEKKILPSTPGMSEHSKLLPGMYEDNIQILSGSSNCEPDKIDNPPSAKRVLNESDSSTMIFSTGQVTFISDDSPNGFIGRNVYFPGCALEIGFRPRVGEKVTFLASPVTDTEDVPFKWTCQKVWKEKLSTSKQDQIVKVNAIPVVTSESDVDKTGNISSNKHIASDTYDNDEVTIIAEKSRAEKIHEIVDLVSLSDEQEMHVRDRDSFDSQFIVGDNVPTGMNELKSKNKVKPEQNLDLNCSSNPADNRKIGNPKIDTESTTLDCRISIESNSNLEKSPSENNQVTNKSKDDSYNEQVQDLSSLNKPSEKEAQVEKEVERQLNDLNRLNPQSPRSPPIVYDYGHQSEPITSLNTEKVRQDDQQKLQESLASKSNTKKRTKSKTPNRNSGERTEENENSTLKPTRAKKVSARHKKTEFEVRIPNFGPSNSSQNSTPGCSRNPSNTNYKTIVRRNFLSGPIPSPYLNEKMSESRHTSSMFEPNSANGHKTQYQENLNQEEENIRPFCCICNKYGHSDSNCWNRLCTLCNMIGHGSNECRDSPCQICGIIGHWEVECWHRPCDICHQQGHRETECHRRTCGLCLKRGHDESDCWYRY